jgi:lipopolysaccharide export LptBFGC system permease protein LptF
MILIAEMTPHQITLVNVLIILNIALLSVVFLFLFFRYLLPWISTFRPNKRNNKISDKTAVKQFHDERSADKAAVAMALYLYFNETHDEESDIITVKRVSKTYSPWSSKLYSMRNLR